MRQLRDRFGLGVESHDERGVRRQLRPQHLDRDRALERDLLAAIDRAHPAFTELRADPITPRELAADEIRHAHHERRLRLGRDRRLAARGTEPRSIGEGDAAVLAGHGPSVNAKIAYTGSWPPRITRTSTRRSSYSAITANSSP